MQHVGGEVRGETVGQAQLGQRLALAELQAVQHAPARAEASGAPPGGVRRPASPTAVSPDVVQRVERRRRRGPARRAAAWASSRRYRRRSTTDCGPDFEAGNAMAGAEPAQPDDEQRRRRPRNEERLEEAQVA